MPAKRSATLTLARREAILIFQPARYNRIYPNSTATSVSPQAALAQFKATDPAAEKVRSPRKQQHTGES